MKRELIWSAAVAVCMTWTIDSLSAQNAGPDTENGRYVFRPSADGVVRLDTRTGAVSTCIDKGQGWACYATPDERAALDAEIGRLQTDNDRLRSELAQRDGGTAQNKTDEALPKSDPLAPTMPRSADGDRKIEIPLPSDRDIDRAMGFFEHVWKRLVEFATRLQRDTDGKI